ncbi:ABC transporter ATP-binding protein/permease [Labrys sp. La1]|uniref:ABC transporter ATP-binding protein/permease n=1 Tax=Labrys sp. La1 TaxID=3404917 RepID=UPI003EB9F7D1
MIRLLAGLSAVSTIGFAAGSIVGPVPLYLPLASLVLTVVLFLSARIPTVLRFLVSLFAFSFLILGGVTALNEAGKVSETVQPYLPPANAAIVASILALLHYLIYFVPVLRRIVDLVNPYFEAEDRAELNLGLFGKWTMRERNVALGLLGLVIVSNVLFVYLNVLFNFWQNRFYTAIQDKAAAAFWTEMGVYGALAFFWVLRGMVDLYISSYAALRWRNWLSGRYVKDWLSDKVHYRLSVAGNKTDNPDQRISEDVRDFVQGSYDNYTGIFSQLLNIYAFVTILWGISAEFPYKIAGYDLSNIPGYLVWMLLAWAILFTYLSHLIGRPLVPLNFKVQRLEADFRYNLVRVRENDEQIALLHGEEEEKRGLLARFASVYQTRFDLLMRQLKLVSVTFAYGQFNLVLPFFLLAPAYFANEAMKSGTLMQTADAFGNIIPALSFFVTSYAILAAYKATIDRLTGFDLAIVRANAARDEGVHAIPVPQQGIIEGKDVDVALPNGANLLKKTDFSLPKGVRTLVTGPSGSGKTTLFRAIAGIWPYGKGIIALPETEDVMLLPQQPYFPLGSLRSALAYPHGAEAFEEQHYRAVLEQVGLGELSDRLDADDKWDNTLSGGEKQRIALARAILRRPAWLLLDEATSALDETSEADLYGLLRRALPDTTIVSIGHRSSLAGLHDRRLAVVPDETAAHIEERPLAEFGAR